MTELTIHYVAGAADVYSISKSIFKSFLLTCEGYPTRSLDVLIDDIGVCLQPMDGLAAVAGEARRTIVSQQGQYLGYFSEGLGLLVLIQYQLRDGERLPDDLVGLSAAA